MLRIFEYEVLHVYRNILKFLVRYLTHSQLNQLSQCHPPRHPFTSRMRQWQPMKTALSHPQLFGSGSTNQRRLTSAPDPVSGRGQPITNAPAHLMHCGLLAGSRQDCTGGDPHTGAVDPSHYSDHRPIRCIISLSHVAWQTMNVCILSFVSLCVCVCMRLFMHQCVCVRVHLRNSGIPFP